MRVEKAKKINQPNIQEIINDVLKLMAAATHKLESIMHDESQLSSDIGNESTTAETSSTPDGHILL